MLLFYGCISLKDVLPCSCRHGFVLAAVNMKVGEKWAYAICLMHILISIHNVWPFISLYDINCRWGKHFRQFVCELSTWNAWQRAWALAPAAAAPDAAPAAGETSLTARMRVAVMNPAQTAAVPPAVQSDHLQKSTMTARKQAQHHEHQYLNTMTMANNRSHQ